MIPDDVKRELKVLDLSKNVLNRFVFTLSITFTGLALWFYFTERDSRYLLLIGLVFILFIIRITTNKLLAKLYKFWMAIALFIGWCMSRIILLFVFFLIITPVALLMRIAGKEFLPFMKKNSSPSYWIEKKSIQNSMEKLF